MAGRLFLHDMKCADIGVNDRKVVLKTHPVAIMHQLAAVGPQDAYTHIDPEGTFFKTKHLRYTHFGLETRELHFDRQLNYHLGGHFPLFSNKTNVISCEIPKLDHRLYTTGVRGLVLDVTLPPLPQELEGSTFVEWSRSIMFAMIEKVNLKIDGNIIQSVSGKFMFINSDLSVPVSKRTGYKRMTGKGVKHDGKSEVTYHLPLSLWFNDCTIFPIGTLSPKVKVTCEVHMRPLLQCVKSDRNIKRSFHDSVLCEVKLLCDYVWMHRSELKEYANMELLIEQTQEHEMVIEPNVSDVKFELLTTNATKRCHWVIQDVGDTVNNTVFGNEHTNFSGWSVMAMQSRQWPVQLPCPVHHTQLYLANEAREPRGFRDLSFSDETRVHEMFYRFIQPYKISKLNIPSSKYIFSYFFAMNPLAIYPSGHYDMGQTSNFIKLKLVEGLRRTVVTFFAVSYNILVVKDGYMDVKYVD